MGIRWKTFEMPKRLEVDKSTLTLNYGKFVAEPFERGYGTTIGNALRRILISSIEGAAVTSIKVQGMLHEFSSLEGVMEDGAQVVLNIKKLVVKYHGKGPKKVMVEAKKKGPVTARDIQADETIEIVNPDQLLCTLTKDTPFKKRFKRNGLSPLEVRQPLALADRSGDGGQRAAVLRVSGLCRPRRSAGQ